MKWYEREFGFKGQPYRYFLADVVWSAVAVALVAFVMILMDASPLAIAAACAVCASLFAPMILGRIAAARPQRAAQARARPRGFAPIATSRTLTGM